MKEKLGYLYFNLSKEFLKKINDCGGQVVETGPVFLFSEKKAAVLQLNIIEYILHYHRISKKFVAGNRTTGDIIYSTAILSIVVLELCNITLIFL